nr:uncharacterized protein si:dkey-192g7.3 isoform X1 [Misgurnus anguillicaudatus]
MKHSSWGRHRQTRLPEEDNTAHKMRSNMENMTLMLVLLLIEGLAVGQSTVGQSTKSSNVGHDVLLPCLCPSNPDELVWQIGERVVSVYSQNKDAINSIDKMFINRTKLFLHMNNTNCSMLLHNVSLVDAGVYTCHALNYVQDNISSRNALDVNLTVSENIRFNDLQKGEEDKTIDKTSIHIAIPVLILIILLAAGLILFLLLRRRRQNHQNIIYVPAEPMMNIV